MHDNLLNILGGGITQIAASSYPAPFGSTLALMFYVDPIDVGKAYALEVTCHHEGSDINLWGWAGDMVSEEPMMDQLQTVSLPLNFALMGLPEPGSYELVVKANGDKIGAVPFKAVQIDEPRV
ncbi:hypothetical protein RWH43_00825 [Microbacterium sp. KSW2-21]|uniref:Uncharacterized protein n=1 Tax=Microbacterium algihabitans TaxID=3075992 RepID=A0ABU3RRB9_9MICO|nr:hypothetical protein [Microbacterium sp. KSW2-21]MDU0325287.1 hypothetical protein [Microbacterium sp. KSW2-21]